MTRDTHRNGRLLEGRVRVEGLEPGLGGGGAALAHDPVPPADVGGVGPVQGGQLGRALGEGAGPGRLEPRVVIAHCVASFDDGHGVQFLDIISHQEKTQLINVTCSSG